MSQGHVNVKVPDVKPSNHYIVVCKSGCDHDSGDTDPMTILRQCSETRGTAAPSSQSWTRPSFRSSTFVMFSYNRVSVWVWACNGPAAVIIESDIVFFEVHYKEPFHPETVKHTVQLSGSEHGQTARMYTPADSGDLRGRDICEVQMAREEPM